MDIPLIGNTASRALAQRFHSSLDEFEAAVCGRFDFTQLPDFGETLHRNIYGWFGQEENWYLWSELRNYVHISPPVPEHAEPVPENPFVGLARWSRTPAARSMPRLRPWVPMLAVR
jgi:DNA ligase (NAD+)